MPELDWFRIVETSIGALVGAGLGAFLAFKLEERRRHKDKRRQQVAALNQCYIYTGSHVEKIAGD